MADISNPRRLAAILAADVAGYTQLVEQDTDGTVAAWKAARDDVIKPLVTEISGRIIKFTGDGFLVEFPSVQDAVACAIAMQEKLTNSALNFRMGLNVGDITDDGGDVHGEGVNIAARLEGLAEPGGICISGDVHSQIRNRIDATFTDMGEHQVKHVSHPVRVFAINSVSSDKTKTSPTRQVEKPAIAVLPFDNMSGDPEQEYFSDGITEDIITALSRSHWFFVIARNSSFSYKGTSPDVRVVARELGVQYVLEGSVRKAGSRVRVVAQLIDAQSGNHIWANQYDRELHDVFVVQDEITEAIAGEIAPSFVAAEVKRARRKGPEHLDSWDLAMRGNWHLWQMTRDGFSEAQRLFLMATDVDPESSFAHSGLALAYLFEAGAALATDPTENRSKGEVAARKAVELDDQNAWAHVVLGWARHIACDNNAAAVACKKALELDPNLAPGEGLLGLISAHLSDYDAAERRVANALRLSPRDTSAPFWKLATVVAALVTDRQEEYLENAKEMTKSYPTFFAGWRHLVAAYAMAGQLDRAKIALQQLFLFSPNDRLETIRKGAPFSNDEARERYIEALRKAGLPE